MPRHPLRALLRLLGFLAIVAAALADLGVRAARGALAGRPLDVRVRAAWLHRWTARALGFMGFTLEVEGDPPREGVLVSNHLGYLDIFVFSAIAPTVFVSNHTVRSWPLAGVLARLAGTIFIDRTRRADVLRVGQTMAPVVAAGQPVALFLEGTSTGGDRVLPFHSSLLAPAVRAGWPVTPAFLSYAAPGAEVARDIAYWGEAVFFPHFLGVLGLPRAEARVRFGAPITGEQVREEDRRALAQRLRQAICALGAEAGHPGL